MSPFWQNFNNNGKARHAPVNELRQALAEACEDFALLTKMPKWQRKQTLLTELKNLADHYRIWGTWRDVR